MAADGERSNAIPQLRLKLQCFPPAVSYERNGANGNARLGMQGVLDFDNSSNSGDEDYMCQTGPSLGWDNPDPSHHINIPPQSYDPNNLGPFTTPPCSAPMNQQEFAFNDVSTMPMNGSQTSFHEQNLGINILQLT